MSTEFNDMGEPQLSPIQYVGFLGFVIALLIGSAAIKADNNHRDSTISEPVVVNDSTQLNTN